MTGFLGLDEADAADDVEPVAALFRLLGLESRFKGLREVFTGLLGDTTADVEADVRCFELVGLRTSCLGLFSIGGGRVSFRLAFVKGPAFKTSLRGLVGALLVVFRGCTSSR